MSKAKATTTAEPTAIEALLGPTLLTKKGSTGKTATLLQDKQLVALYFSASWCPPCKAFSPVLADFYIKYAAQNGVEMVYVSSDRTLDDFEAYYAKMPWLALPHASPGQPALAAALKIQGIPSLVVLDVQTGLLVTADARTDVQRSHGTAAAAMETISQWKAATPVSFEVGLAQPMDPLSLLKRAVLHLLKNPVWMFGLIYMIKYAIRQFGKTSGGAASTTALEEEDAAAALHHEPIPDDEF